MQVDDRELSLGIEYKPIYPVLLKTQDTSLHTQVPTKLACVH